MTANSIGENTFQNTLWSAVSRGNIAMTRHAENRRLRRGFSRSDIEQIIRDFVIIEEYPNAYPLPAALFGGVSQGVPLHVVAAFDIAKEVVYVVTVYRPDIEHFEPDWKTRRSI